VKGGEVDAAKAERAAERQSADPAEAVDEGTRALRFCHCYL